MQLLLFENKFILVGWSHSRAIPGFPLCWHVVCVQPSLLRGGYISTCGNNSLLHSGLLGVGSTGVGGKLGSTLTELNSSELFAVILAKSLVIFPKQKWVHRMCAWLCWEPMCCARCVDMYESLRCKLPLPIFIFWHIRGVVVLSPGAVCSTVYSIKNSSYGSRVSSCSNVFRRTARPLCEGCSRVVGMPRLCGAASERV